MKFFAGSDGRVYCAHDDRIVSLDWREAYDLIGQLARAVNEATQFATSASLDPMPKEVTRELLK